MKIIAFIEDKDVIKKILGAKWGTQKAEKSIKNTIIETPRGKAAKNLRP